MTTRPAAGLLGRPVHVRGIRLGRVADVIFDADATRVVGFDVLCGDDVHRFLPLPAARVDGDRLEVSSALMLLDEQELEFYRRNGCGLSARAELGDVAVADDGGVGSAAAASGDVAARW